MVILYYHRASQTMSCGSVWDRNLRFWGRETNAKQIDSIHPKLKFWDSHKKIESRIKVQFLCTAFFGATAYLTLSVVC